MSVILLLIPYFATDATRIPDFNMSQELSDHMMEKEGNDRHVPLDRCFGDADSLPSAAAENDNNYNNNADHTDVIEEEDTSCKGRYVKSVALDIAMVHKLFTRYV